MEPPYRGASPPLHVKNPLYYSIKRRGKPLKIVHQLVIKRERPEDHVIKFALPLPGLGDAKYRYFLK